jgi:hypothetical protein
MPGELWQNICHLGLDDKLRMIGFVAVSDHTREMCLGKSFFVEADGKSLNRLARQAAH